jgi:pimeloyl-ACP methyl ester carboxylesterase
MLARYKRKNVLLTLGVAFAAVVAVFILGQAERGANFEYDRTVGPKRVVKMVVKQPGILDVAVCRCAPDKNVRLQLLGGFETAASIYDRGGPGPRPGIIFVHGNTWLGRKLATYRLLASLLADKGFIVLTFDQPGFGEFDDPFGRGPDAVAAAYNGLALSSTAIDYLIQNTPVDSRRISIFGHSGGIDLAIAFGLSREEIASVLVMIAPPGGSGTPGTKQYKEDRSKYFSRRFLDTYRFIYGREIPDWFSWELTKVSEFYQHSREMEALLRRPGHKPVMLLLGERDQPSGHAQVKQRYEQWTEPKQLLTLKGADHYLNTAQSLGMIFYDRTVARQLTNELVPWLLALPGSDLVKTQSSFSQRLGYPRKE